MGETNIAREELLLAMDELAPGFRFYPTEEELVSFYLPNKLQGSRRELDRVIPVLDIYQFNPWELPQFAGELCHGDPEQWFFFIPRREKEARGGRPNRLTTTGYWKATGSPGYVYSSQSQIIGVKRTMVFYNGRASKGKKTQWKMNEYRSIQAAAAPSDGACKGLIIFSPYLFQLRQEFSLCRVYLKTKLFRSFDRRPPGVAAGQDTLAGQAQVQGDEDDHIYETTASGDTKVLAAVVDRSGSSCLLLEDDHASIPPQDNNWGPLWNWVNQLWF